MMLPPLHLTNPNLFPTTDGRRYLHRHERRSRLGHASRPHSRLDHLHRLLGLHAVRSLPAAPPPPRRLHPTRRSGRCSSGIQRLLPHRQGRHHRREHGRQPRGDSGELRYPSIIALHRPVAHHPPVAFRKCWTSQSPRK